MSVVTVSRVILLLLVVCCCEDESRDENDAVTRVDVAMVWMDPGREISRMQSGEAQTLLCETMAVNFDRTTSSSQ